MLSYVDLHNYGECAMVGERDQQILENKREIDINYLIDKELRENQDRINLLNRFYKTPIYNENREFFNKQLEDQDANEETIEDAIKQLKKLMARKMKK